MTGTVKGIPDGASVVIPRLFCRDPVAAIEFCTATFGAVEHNRRPGADGKTAPALLTIGPAMVMIESEWPGAKTLVAPTNQFWGDRSAWINGPLPWNAALPLKPPFHALMEPHSAYTVITTLPYDLN